MKINKIVDLGCGDFNWMKELDINFEYIGCDVVPEVIQENKIKYSKSNLEFINLDIIESDLPDGDLYLCRDCLVHLNNQQVEKMLQKLRGRTSYFLATSFIKRHSNPDISTGEWRPINLLEKPFNMPEPLTIINENTIKYKDLYPDKSLLLWNLECS